MNTCAKFLRQFICFCIPLYFLLFSCSWFEDENKDDMVPDPILENSYTGLLTLNYTSLFPEFNETAIMSVDVDKETGLITIESGSSNYSGETNTSPESKIKRTGSWSINPTGYIENHDGELYVQVDAGVVVESDVTEVWALVNGSWQLMNKVDESTEPNSDLSFKLMEAVLEGAVLDAQGNAGGEQWVLLLSVEPDK